MAYNPISQHDAPSPASTSSEPANDRDPPALFLATSNYDGSHGMLDSLASPSTGAAYDMLEDHDSQASPTQGDNELHVERKRSHQQSDDPQTTNIEPQPTRPSTPEQASMRSASLRSVPLRHPTPDVSMPGSLVGNVEHLERTAERLSMTSDMGLEIQKMHLEQKRSDSRRSSLLPSPELPAVNKQFSSNSIVEINNAARSGGYSPGGFMISPRSSISNRGRSASKSSRYSSRPEPEYEGRPLDSIVNSLATLSPVNSRASSFAEGAEMSTMARALAGENVTSKPLSSGSRKGRANSQPDDSERPTTSASQNTIEQAQRMFQDFDGVHSHHFVSRSRATSTSEDGFNLGPNSLQGHRVPGNLPRPEPGNMQTQSGVGSRMSSAPSAARPQSYSDPKTGQQYVYYPAPVPATLNLPPKLSNKPSSTARDRRKSQTLSNVPEGSPDVPENDVESTQNGGTGVQSQRPASSGRRLTQDMTSITPPIAGIASFNHPSIEKRIPQRNSRIESKGQSATATLDSLLDAAATAPVNAFVDHGAEVYGKSGQRKSPTTTAQEEEKKEKRRSSFGNWLARKSGLEYDFDTITTDLSALDIQKAREREKEKERRRSMLSMSDAGKLQTGKQEDESHEATPLHVPIDDYDEGQFNDEVYLGPPTTLLAELQLRKQQARQRTQPISSTYRNGVHSTLIELDTVAEMEKRAREKKRIALGWQDTDGQTDDEDEDVPLGILYPGQVVSQPRNRPIGLLERRDLEDNEPLSRRRNRLRPAMETRRSSSMLDMPLPGEDRGKRESFLASSRPVSGDFASELMSQFGGDLLGDDKAPSKDKGKGKAIDTEGTGPVREEEETLAQRKKRLRAERQAREAEVGQGLGLRNAPIQEARPQLRQRKSMADILSANPAAGRSSPGPQLVTRRSSSYSLGGGLLALHDQEAKRRSGALSIDKIKATPKPPGTQRQPNRASSMTMATMGTGMGMMGVAPYGAAPGFQNLAAMQSTPQFYSPTMALNFHGNSNGFGQGMNQMNLIQQQQQQQQQYMMAGYGAYQPNYGFGAQMPYNGMGMTPAGYNGQMGIGMTGFAQPMNGMGMQQMPLSQAQLDMVERWRQSISQ